MPQRHVLLRDDVPEELRVGVRELQEKLGVAVDFPDAVAAEVAERLASGPLPAERVDATDIEFVAIDPEGSQDLDQIVHIERRGAGYRVRYGIADVAAWVTPGGAIDRAARSRGQTYYLPTHRVPLHPPALSEGAASLLADGTDRPSLLWTIDLDSDGLVETSRVERALVRNRAQLNYVGVQKDLDAGTASESLSLLREVGRLREQVEIDRGGVSLNLPEQLIVTDGPKWRLQFRTPLPVEGWNAQISLLTGSCAAELMVGAGVGILRTLPPADRYAVRKLRAIASSLDIPWPSDLAYPDFVRSLDVAKPEHQAMLNACTLLFRGAGYTVVDPTKDQQLLHGALAMRYAHTTAPLRRLVDRFTGTACAAISAGVEVPDWVVEALDDLPKLMGESDRTAKSLERGLVNLTEALVLTGRRGELFRGTIIDIDERFSNRGVASVPLIAVEALVTGNKLELGAEMELELTRANVRTGEVAFTVR